MFLNDGMKEMGVLEVTSGLSSLIQSEVLQSVPINLHRSATGRSLSDRAIRVPRTEECLPTLVLRHFETRDRYTYNSSNGRHPLLPLAFLAVKAFIVLYPKVAASSVTTRLRTVLALKHHRIELSQPAGSLFRHAGTTQLFAQDHLAPAFLAVQATHLSPSTTYLALLFNI